MSFHFTVPGDPVPWARADGGMTVNRFTPPRQRKYMAAMKLICQAAMKGASPFEGAVRIEVMAIYGWPKSWSTKKREQVGKWKTSRPDHDNLLKLVGDALNGVAWTDDAKIAAAHVWKLFDTEAKLRVRVEGLQ